MPLADYQCPGCPGVIIRDHYFSSTVGAKASAPHCPICGIDAEVIPQVNFDMKTDGTGGKGFQKFTVHRQVPTRDGIKHVEETVDSIHKLRQIEKDSEQRYRDGEGEPLRFRAYAQNGSNMDTPSFGRAGRIGDMEYSSGQQPRKKKNISTTRHGEKKPKAPLGPGMRRAASALKG